MRFLQNRWEFWTVEQKPKFPACQKVMHARGRQTGSYRRAQKAKPTHFNKNVGHMGAAPGTPKNAKNLASCQLRKNRTRRIRVCNKLSGG